MRRKLVWQNVHVFERDVKGSRDLKEPARARYWSRRDRHMAEPTCIERLGADAAGGAVGARRSRDAQLSRPPGSKHGLRPRLGVEVRQGGWATAYRTVGFTYTRATDDRRAQGDATAT